MSLLEEKCLPRFFKAHASLTAPAFRTAAVLPLCLSKRRPSAAPAFSDLVLKIAYAPLAAAVGARASCAGRTKRQKRRPPQHLAIGTKNHLRAAGRGSRSESVLCGADKAAEKAAATTFSDWALKITYALLDAAVGARVSCAGRTKRQKRRPPSP